MGLISAKALLRPGLLGTIQFPAELFDRDWEKVEYVASREEFTFLATMKLVVGMGSRAGVKRLRLTGPLSRAYENAAREAKLTRLSRSRPPLEFLHRMQADRQFVRKVQIIEHVDPETRVAVRTGKWYWEHK
jgi:hypothetical protein